MSAPQPWRSREVFRRGGLALLGFCLVLPLGAGLVVTMLGFPFAGYVMAKLMERTLDDARAAHGVSTRPGPISVVTGVFCFVAVGSVAGLVLGAAHTFAHAVGAGREPWVAVAASASLGALVFAALSPLAFTPFASSTAGARFWSSFSNAARRASVVDGRRLALAGAVSGAALSAGLASAGPLSEWLERPVLVLFLGPLLFGLSLAPAVVVFASAYATAEAQQLEDAPAAARRISRWIWMLAPAAAMAFAALALAAVTPAPLTPVRGPRTGHGISRAFAPSARLPGTSVRARGVPGGVEIVADDGGGAGRIELPTCGHDITPLVAVHAEEGGRFRVIAQGSDGYGATRVDADGVRLDDGLVQRVRSRGGFAGVELLALGMLALLLLAWRLGVEQGELKSLDAAALLEPGVARGAGRVALTGRLVLSQGAKTFYRAPSRLLRLVGVSRGGAQLRVEGEAWLEALGGGLRVRLPEAIPVFPGPLDKRWDGETLTILSRFTELQPTGLRESSSPFPEDGRVVLGTPEYATRALAEHITAVVAPLTVLGVLALVGGSLFFFFAF